MPSDPGVRVGPGLLGETGAVLRALLRPDPGPLLVVTDANVAALHLDPLLAALGRADFAPRTLVLPPGEESKTLPGAERIWGELLAAGADRSSAVVALGGGVVTDLAGFAAATFLRGIPWIAVPTSVLAQVDAAVGGKTGVNRPEGKNLVGAFHPPIAVLADTLTLSTLPARHLRNGLAEVVKVGLGLSPELFLRLERDREALLAGDEPALRRAVLSAVGAKLAIVAEDEREGGVRRKLNLGHTAGHAIEAAAGFGPVLHGEAVAVGLGIASRIAVRRGRLDPAVPPRLEALLVGLGLPAAMADLPVRPDAETVRAHLLRDKKRTQGRLALVLPTRIGDCVVVEDGSPDEVLAAL